MRKKYYTNCKIGYLKQKVYKYLQKKYGFKTWHVDPINFRPYAINVVETLSGDKIKTMMSEAPIVEVGCGLGEIVSNISTKNKRYGYDIEESVIRAAKLVSPNVMYVKGSFDRISQKNISCLIMVGLTHGLEPIWLQEQIRNLLNRCDVDMFVIDIIKNRKSIEGKKNYPYEQDGDMLFEGKYYLYKRSKGFPAAGGARRYIEYWAKLN